MVIDENSRIAVVTVSRRGPRGHDGAANLPPGQPGQLVAYGEAGEPVARTLTPDSIGAAPAVHTHPANQITDLPDLVVLFENKLI